MTAAPLVIAPAIILFLAIVGGFGGLLVSAAMSSKNGVHEPTWREPVSPRKPQKSCEGFTVRSGICWERGDSSIQPRQ